MKAKLPWLVKERDLRRYLYRALAAARRGRVVLFYHPYKDEREPRLMCLAPHENFRPLVAAALLAYRSGRYKRVLLADLPELTRQTK